MTETNRPWSWTRWWRIAVSVCLLTVLCGCYITLQVLPKVYTATAEIEVRPQNVRTVPSLDNASDYSFDSTAFQAELDVIRSPDVLLPIIQDLRLDEIWAMRLHKAPREKLHPAEALAYMNKILKLELKPGTDIVTITVSSAVPTEAAQIANAVADRYKVLRDVQEDQRNRRGMESILEFTEKQKQLVNEKKAEMDKLRDSAAAKGVQLTAPSDDRDEQDLDEREKDLLAAKVDCDARRVLVEQIQKLPDDEYMNTLEALGKNTVPIKTKYSSLKTEIENLAKNGAKDGDPRITARRKEMQEFVAGLRRAMQIDLDTAQSRMALLQKKVDGLKAKIDQAPHSQPPELKSYRQAQRDLEEQQSILSALELRLKQVESTKMLLLSPVRIISRAEPPKYPSSPNKAMCMLVSAFAGLVLGAGVATVAVGWPRWN